MRFGQRLYINPRERLVIVVLGARSKPEPELEWMKMPSSGLWPPFCTVEIVRGASRRRQASARCAKLLI
jgi:CubicO group peptidase (beta-lactamase class C family)